ncbi:LCP family protein [uncultured Arcanobacterium sp.]|uniref:LCP family protein n=1 Tax=uncultured Arcanobacterium sp. TaxID=487520 RepID=UPI002611E970|nr:LCP family protein [uncultured Arcanobacterium sp.]
MTKSESARPKKMFGKHRRALSSAAKIRRIFGLFFLSLLLGLGSLAATVIYNLQGNINQHDFTDLLKGAKRPGEVIPLDQKEGMPINVLLIGSDSRERIDPDSEVTGMRSDTVMLVHISADRQRADFVSIPRDTLVDIPSCQLTDDERSYPQKQQMFNSAFSTGGIYGDVNAAATCTLRTVEKLTDVVIDGWVVIDFVSFQGIVNTLGGVEMCFEEAIHEDFSGLDVAAGCQNLNGEQALALARMRYGIDDGSDLSRIKRQHELVGKIAEKMLSMNLASDLPKFYSIVKEITQNLDTSSGLGNFRWLSGFLYSLRNLQVKNINFLTMPNHYAPDQPGRVVPADNADLVWAALRRDMPISPEILSGDKKADSQLEESEESGNNQLLNG